MTSALLIERNRETATMTSAYLLEESGFSKAYVSISVGGSWIQQSLRQHICWRKLDSAKLTSAYLLEETEISNADVSIYIEEAGGSTRDGPTVLQLRDNAQRWWRGISRILHDSGAMIIWESFCEAFRQEYTSDSYYNSPNQERTKRNKFLKDLRPDLYRMVLSGSPATYIDAVNRAMDIEESLLEEDAATQPITGRTHQPVQDASKSFYSPQGSQQHTNRQRFRPRGKQFKKKANSSSSGSGSGTGGMSCGQCGGRHSQCRGVQGFCHNCEALCSQLSL
ncbi:hypothetical protein F511_27288 [Dorcoceras hygrometricum]|uniref:Retrotransposon gag domain-containing protein n=1 Tax=Dorcoceras hygrometricum TaxID=472368 RepID=A0A2Z7AQX4_9LAMI|nr:hypothetical protein F511_27288 [Dorcoceras hygrometricum]